MTKAEIILDSMSSSGQRLTTLVVTFPKIILPEMLTHRIFSRNTASSRAIPAEKMVRAVMLNPYIPAKIYAPEKGMANRQELPWEDQQIFLKDYKEHLAKTVELVFKWKDKVSKEHLNRLIEPFSYTTQIVSSTNFEGFFEQRIHEDAHPLICDLAQKMKYALDTSEPQTLNEGYWHLPFYEGAPVHDVDINDKLLIRLISKVARVSYTNHDKNDELTEYYTGIKVLSGKPLHNSPLEHFACVDRLECKKKIRFLHESGAGAERLSNFCYPFYQLRHNNGRVNQLLEISKEEII